MHMESVLVTPVVAGTFYLASGGSLGYAIRKAKEELTERKIYQMGVAGALVFSLQMLNFPILNTGSSGHIVGGILLAALLNPYVAFITISVVLGIQSLFFADGGILALGCNIFNMGLIPCLLVYPYVFEPIVKRKDNRTTRVLAAILASVISLQLGAFGVVIQTVASGITELPFSSFLLKMQPIHLAIGLGEGLITAGLLVLLYEKGTAVYGKNQWKKNTFVLTGLLAVVAGGLSVLASSFPDGLEWSVEAVAQGRKIQPEGVLYGLEQSITKVLSIMPDYTLEGFQGQWNAPFAAIIGMGMVVIFSGLLVVRNKIK